MVLLVSMVAEVAAAVAAAAAVCIQFHCLVLALLDPDLLHSGCQALSDLAAERWRALCCASNACRFLHHIDARWSKEQARQEEAGR